MNVLSGRPGRAGLWATAAMGALMVAGLLWTADQQIYDTNYISIWEATSLWAGDHPYRDFLEYGVPLQMALSALVLPIAGGRLLGEFVTQWLGITLGVVLSFRVALRASASIAASAVVMLLVVIGLMWMPTYHYPHVMLYSTACWLAWRYVDRPSPSRGAWLGALTAIGFLFRHDHGLYIGIGAVATFLLARGAVPSSRTVGSMARDAAAYSLVLTLLLSPWMAVVQASEGLPEYVRMRNVLFQAWSDDRDFTYRRLWTMNPIQTLTPAEDSDTGLPAPDRALLWLLQVTLLVPLLTLAGAAWTLAKRTRSGIALPPDLWHTVATAALLIVIAQRGLRDPGYFTIVAPVTGVLAARLLTERGRSADAAFASGGRAALRMARRVAAGGVLAVSAVSAASLVGGLALFDVEERLESLGPAYGELTASPPIDAHFGSAAAQTLDRETFAKLAPDLRVVLRYLYDCTRPGDRLLVTGSTPYTVVYYTGRPLAGGHLLWHFSWRSDAVREAESLALLQSQSVPFAVSTTEPLLDDFKAYPRIHAHLVEHYAEIEGSGGRLLVDKRMVPNRRYGALQLPCFSREG